MSDSAAERARKRLRDEMHAQHLSTRDLAGLLRWSQSKVSKILNGRIQLLVDDLAALAWAMDLSVVECVRTPGVDFVAEMTPSELMLLTRWRQLRPDQQQAILTVLGVSSVNKEARPTPAVIRKPRR